MRAARELLKDLEYEVVSGSVDVNVNELIYNTKMVSKECMFVCIRGAVFDSHDAAAEAAAVRRPLRTEATLLTKQNSAFWKVAKVA